ncbi:MAG: cell division protein SepF [Actinomycetota bacterium]|nr:cell division protein SepF [Actinomycetota bacterium]
MPGAMRKMGVYLGLVEDDDYGDAYRDPPVMERSSRSDDYAEPRYSREHAHSREMAHAGGRGGYADESDGYASSFSEESSPAYQITTLHPRTYNEARTIGEHFRKNTPVIMNLSEMEDADAKRLVDFAAGLTFGLHGRIERVTAKVFLLSPHNVTVTAQDKARIAETGFFNQS